jgi:hypothetical protein
VRRGPALLLARTYIKQSKNSIGPWANKAICRRRGRTEISMGRGWRCWPRSNWNRTESRVLTSAAARVDRPTIEGGVEYFSVRSVLVNAASRAPYHERPAARSRPRAVGPALARRRTHPSGKGPKEYQLASVKTPFLRPALTRRGFFNDGISALTARCGQCGTLTWLTPALGVRRGSPVLSDSGRGFPYPPPAFGGAPCASRGGAYPALPCRSSAPARANPC